MVKALDLSEFTTEEIRETLKEIRQPVEIAVCDSSNYFNMGSIIRTSHSFLVSKIYAVNLEKYYKKAAMSARKYEKDNIIKYSTEEFLENTQGRNIVSMERRPDLDTKSLFCYDWPENPIIVLGGEKFGVPQEILKASCDIVSIPMQGLIHDFNVACAASIALYDWSQKHHRKNQ